MGRSKAVSEDVQWIVVRLATKMKPDEISMYTGISVRSIERILAYFQSNRDVPAPKQSMHARKGKLVSEIMELKEAFGVSADKSTIWRALRRKGYTMKKLSRVAIERSAEKRAEFGAHIGTYEAEQLIFVDKSAVDRRTTY
ncbi:hypothetical protein APHAL10511_007748 [Amanita phalloides]|nr:hypothetical protein APHAL10511_007748 [Amanita phalloides]